MPNSSANNDNNCNDKNSRKTIISVRVAMLMIVLKFFDDLQRSQAYDYDYYESNNYETTSESSDKYLQNVVNELQRFNGQDPYAVASYDNNNSNDRIVYPTDSLPAPSSRIRISHPVQRYDATNDPKQNVHQTINRPSAGKLGFTPNQLASMYKTALRQGTAIKYNTLVSSLNGHPATTRIVDHINFGESRLPYNSNNNNNYRQHNKNRHQYNNHQGTELDPNYAFYYYPLDTFRQELVHAHHHGYRMPHYNYDLMPAESAKQETSAMHPILVGISSFFGMALFFVLSLFVYPRFIHLFNFPLATTSRMALRSEFSHLGAFVLEAVDFYRSNVEGYKVSSKTTKQQPAAVKVLTKSRVKHKKR